MKKYLLLMTFAIILPFINNTVQAEEEKRTNAAAAISIDEARDIALRAYPGAVTYEESKKTSKGKIINYSFDIEAETVFQNVVVDAKTGKITKYKVKTYRPRQ